LTGRQRAFLAACGRLGIAVAAAKAARVGRCRHYEWLRDSAYRAAFADAQEDAVQHLEQEAHRVQPAYGSSSEGNQARPNVELRGVAIAKRGVNEGTLTEYIAFRRPADLSLRINE
jgi:hypothetical protein